ncbi:DNA polymerase alpha subunit B-like [Pecten maximus]|uniref:DNA polymerase alpha subunit B-like n=1 Tax=Pecten maximus TaxID=6579 RepID=UPI001458509D|nr:DNA polymerase alpha subunit B-like [Pecten maximus]
MASDEDLKDEFSIFGVELENQDVIDKLKELCVLYRLDASKISTEWIAFYNTKTTKGNLTLSCEVLDLFDRERLNKKTPRTPQVKKKSGPTVYDVNTVQNGIDENEAVELYNAYSGNSTPSNTKKVAVSQKRQLTPDNPPMKRFTNSVRSPMVPFSPASFSPGITPSKKFSSRSNAGESVAALGVNDNTDWKGQGHDVHIAYYDPRNAMEPHFKYMFQKLTEKANVLNDMIEDLAKQLRDHYKIEDLSHVALPVQETVTVVGRIGCDSIGKLNAKSVILEGSQETSAGRCIPVDLTELQEFSLFPGQIVAMEGINNTGQKFIAKKLHQGVSLPLPDVAVKSEAGKLSVIVATGPFTTSDNLAYEPLADLCKYLNRDCPDICILLGPFVDVKNDQVEKGNCTTSFDDLFWMQMKSLSDIADNCGCKFIIAPSYRDVHHDYVYPQPPFDPKNLKQNLSKNLHFMPDPCTVCVDNVVFGITSTDILMQLGAEEISCNIPGSTDRLGRLTQHLLTQRNYYPLCPPADEVNIDYKYFEDKGRIPVTPHILIVPSDLKQFVKDIQGCCCINPGRLSKGQNGGTYCRLVIQTDQLSQSTNSSVIPHLSAQVLRV